MGWRMCKKEGEGERGRERGRESERRPRMKDKMGGYEKQEDGRY